ncbi:MAG: response regulator [Candidatus Rokuibacteriota bacterium]|jgi:CheY-like chemotaxis protein|nr:MAG: response regulator [Candidatus Rokubacteria bacterium]
MDPRERTMTAAEVSTERPPRILIIDDDRYVRMLLCDLLTTWGYEADAAADGVEGLALFGRGGYDVVLTDHAMPILSGLDVAASVRHLDPRVSMIMFTAFNGGFDGADRRLRFTVLRKPLEIDGLRRALRDTLAHSASTS